MRDGSTVWLASLYLKTNSWFERGVWRLRSLWVGLWLGLLTRRELHEVDKLRYDQLAKYRSESYNRSGLFPWEQKVIKIYFCHLSSLLVAGAGGGREVLALSRMGYRVDSFECHPDLVAFANRFLSMEEADAAVHFVERDSVLQNDTLYDGVIVGWGAYTLIQGRERRIQFLSKLRKKSVLGGPALLSFYDRESNSAYFEQIQWVGNKVRPLLHAQRIETGDCLVPNYSHFFLEAEVQSELAAAGFQMVYYSADQYAHAVAIAV